MSASSAASAQQEPRVAWLSSGLTALVRDYRWLDPSEAREPDRPIDFDVVIVGSGYGASVAAAELSGCTDARGENLRICVLERGKEYLAGMFPGRQANLFGHVRFATPNADRARGVLDGLYDIRLSDDAMSVVACGVGGGSLINAGVMAEPHDLIFKEARWPDAIQKDVQLKENFALLKAWFEPKVITDAMPAPNHDPVMLAKTRLMGRLARGNTFTPTAVTMAHGAFRNAAGVDLDRCYRCGDCATGCNKNAKNSLDVNLLRVAQVAGVRIVTNATVLSVAPLEGDPRGWKVFVNHTEAHLRDRQRAPFEIRTKRVILAAGTFGSTEILMRSKTVPCSAQLGRKFSANGDMLVMAYGLNESGRSVADETQDPGNDNLPDRRAIGPTITSMIDLRTGNPETDVVIQDLAVPGSLRRAFEQATTTADVINGLARPEQARHDGRRNRPDDAAVDGEAIENSLVLAMIGRDDAEGELVMGQTRIGDEADGLLTVRWPELRLDPRLAAHHERLQERLDGSDLGGRVVGNLVWRPLSQQLEDVFGAQRGPLVTVHPLGGCPMGNDVREGVTDHLGRVFDSDAADPREVHEGLVVLDGSIVPTSLGINPALTISALALRALRQLKVKWNLKGGGLTTVTPEALTARAASDAKGDRRPIFTDLATPQAPRETKVELTEQMRGTLHLADAHGRLHRHEVELTLTTKPVALSKLMARTAGRGRTLLVPPGKGRLRVLREGKKFDPVSDLVDEDHVLLTARISGRVELFRLESSSRIRRILRALYAYLLNRGIRDLWQRRIRKREEKLGYAAPAVRARPADPARASLRARLRKMRTYIGNMLNLLSRAGAVRLLEYELKISQPRIMPGRTGIAPGEAPSPEASAHSEAFTIEMFRRKRISGVKRLTYAYATSPLVQLTQMSLKSFPRLDRSRTATMRFNPRFLARRGVPLFRIVEQEDRISALTDLASFMMYFVRILVQVHAFGFRRPDAPLQRAPQLLPGRLEGLPPPQINWLAVAGDDDATVRIRLARYDGRRGDKAINSRPVLLIHGYSASGTTFAHPSVPGNLVETLVKRGRDVWVLDMRSSAGLPTATTDWKFEDMARKDIPLAVEHVLVACNGTAEGKVDVVGHCMGAAMFSMAVLHLDDDPTNPVHARLATRIGRVVFSQVGPAMLMSAENVFRAYLMRYVRQFLPLEKYEFSPKGENSAVGTFLDRALYPLTQSREEMKRENPVWPLGKATPWVGSRHRMDALYARTFSLNNLSDEVLANFDDFFGPLSVETVSQVIHFASLKTVTDADGLNRYVLPKRLGERLKFPMMSIHGEDNGLVDVGTLELMRNTLVAAEIPYLNCSCRPRLRNACTCEAVSKSREPAEVRQLIRDKTRKLRSEKASYLTWRIKGHGHQDCLIGRQAGEICGVIADFLCAGTDAAAPAMPARAPSPGRGPEQGR